MAGNIATRGLNIVVDGETTKFDKAMSKATAKVKETKDEVLILKRSLQSEWSTEKFIKAQVAAEDAIKATEEKVKLLKESISQVGNADTGEAKAQLKYLTMQIMDAETAAGKAKKSLADIAGSEFKNNLQKANTEIDLTKRKLDTLSTGLSIKWDKSTFVQAQAAARESVEKTHDKLKVLETELRRLENDSSTDRTSDEFKELETQIGEVKLEAIQAEQKLSSINQIKFDKVTGILDKLGSSMMRGGAVLTAGVTLPLAYVGKQALETASDLQEVQNVVDVSFKESSKSIDSWSKSLLYSNGISELTAKQNAGLYKSMANGMGVADEAGTEMSQTLTELIGDVASFKNLSFDVVGTKLKSVFTGETESLKDIGVVMTEANLNAYALANGMEQLSNDMSQAEKVNLRYKFVVDSLKDAQGDFARTIDSTANQTKLAQEQFKSLSIELAEELLPIATDILKWANETMKAFSGMSDSAKTTTLVIIGLAAGIGPAVTVIGALSKAVSVTAKMVNTFKKANDAATISQAALNAVSAMNPYVLIATAIAALTVGVMAFANANDEAGKKQREVNEEIAKLESGNISEANARIAELKLSAEFTIPRIEELGDKVNRTAGENELLKSYIEKLNTVMGYEAAAIDIVTGKLVMNTAEIEKNIVALERKALSDAVSDKLLNEKTKILDTEIELAEKQLEEKELLQKIADIDDKIIKASPKDDELMETSKKDNNASFASGPLYQLNLDRATYSQSLNAVQSYIADREKIVAASMEVQKKYMDFVRNSDGEIAKSAGASYELTDNPRKNPLYRQSSGLTAEQKARNDKLMQEEKHALDARMDLGMYSEQVYYDKLKEIRSKYYGDRQKDAIDMTDIEHSLNKEIHTQEVVFQKQREAAAKASNSQVEADTKKHSTEQTKVYKEMYDKQKKLSKDAYDENKKLLKSSYDETKKKLDADYKDEISRIDNALKHKEDNINSAIKAIDKEIEARKRLKQSEEFDSQIDVLKGQLSYDKMDEFTKRELEAELKRLEDEKSDYAWELAQTDRKEELQQELSDAQERASREKANLQEMLDINKTALEETYNLQFENLEAAYQLHSEQLESMFNSASVKMADISSSFVSTISSGIDAAIGKLSGMVAKANEETSKIAHVKNYSSNDYSQRKAEVNINGTNYTAGQLQRIAQREIDKILYQ